MAVAHKLSFAALVLVVLLTQGASRLFSEMRKDVEYAKPGGVTLKLDAFVPDIGVGPYPAVIVVHGGGFTEGDKSDLKPVFQILTKARFVWFSINYRLAPQFHFPAAADDVTAAVEWVRAHAAEYKVDPKRIALLGESAGAFLVDYVAVKSGRENRIAAVVSFYGPSDLEAEARAGEGGKINPGIAAFFGIPALDGDNEKRLREASPINLLHRHLPPFLLIHGTADEQVAFDQSIQFRRALQDHDTKVELIAVEGGKHGLENWEELPAGQDYKATLVEWLRATLR